MVILIAVTTLFPVYITAGKEYLTGLQIILYT